jgi:AcrR family transcriptional regulator
MVTGFGMEHAQNESRSPLCAFFSTQWGFGRTFQERSCSDHAAMTDTVTDLKRPRTKPAAVRRAELMDAAQALLLEKGFALTSVDEIVRAADVAKGTFYLHFRTKDEVLLALRERYVAIFSGRLQTALSVPGTDNPGERLDAWIAAAVDGYLDQVALHDLVFHEFRPSSRRLQHDNPVISQLSTFLLDGARQGAWMVEDARLAAVMMFHCVHGAVDECVVAPRPPDRSLVIRSVRSFCRRALGLKEK